ncbi:MAG: hypothetical protein R3F54_24385 [Alphaproteobacteria bacterium]
MKEEKTYKLSIGSADEYKDLIAEIRFPGKGGVIVSQENGQGMFEISLHSFRERSADDFDFCRNIDDAKMPLADLMEAIGKATSELGRLKKE